MSKNAFFLNPLTLYKGYKIYKWSLAEKKMVKEFDRWFQDLLLTCDELVILSDLPARMDVEKFRSEIEKFLDEAVALTNASLIYAPSQVINKLKMYSV